MKRADKQRIVDTSRNEATKWAADKFGVNLTQLACLHLNKLDPTGNVFRLRIWRTLQKREKESRSWMIAKQVFERTVKRADKAFRLKKNQK